MKKSVVASLAVAGIATLALAACAPAKPVTTQAAVKSATASASPTTSAVAQPAALPQCSGTAPASPALTEGPYYVAGDFVRSDITEGQAGMPMALTIQVVDTSCNPVANARVDIWHANAQGQYSGVTDPKEGCADCGNLTFLRGTQTTDANGMVTFQTIFPGWYPGRTVHIHVKLWEGDQQVLTSQFFVSQSDADTVFATTGYKGTQDTTNEQDRIAQQAGSGLAGLTISNAFAGGGDTASVRLVLR